MRFIGATAVVVKTLPLLYGVASAIPDVNRRARLLVSNFLNKCCDKELTGGLISFTAVPQNGGLFNSVTGQGGGEVEYFYQVGN